VFRIRPRCEERLEPRERAPSVSRHSGRELRGASGINAIVRSDAPAVVSSLAE
jgi:hypothetical protein